MPHKDTSNKQSRSCILRTCYAFTDTSKSPATNASHRCQQNRRYIYIYIYSMLPYLTWIPANHRQQILYLTMAHTHTRIHGQQKGHLAMPHAYTSKSQEKIVPCLRYQQIRGNKAHLLCLLRKLANHRQQIVHLLIASHKCQQHTSNKSHILQCFLQVQESHRPSCQQIVHLAMPHADTSKSRQQIVNFPCFRQISAVGMPCSTPPSYCRIDVGHTLPHPDLAETGCLNYGHSVRIVPL